MEDEVVVEFVLNQLEAGGQAVDGKTMQINLTGFLNGSKAREFMGDLWQLLYAAQSAPQGIPPQLLQAKADELLQRVCLSLLLVSLCHRD